MFFYFSPGVVERAGINVDLTVVAVLCRCVSCRSSRRSAVACLCVGVRRSIDGSNGACACLADLRSNDVGSNCAVGSVFFYLASVSVAAWRAIV